jgi:hypothetical protein
MSTQDQEVEVSGRGIKTQVRTKDVAAAIQRLLEWNEGGADLPDGYDPDAIMFQCDLYAVLNAAKR